MGMKRALTTAYHPQADGQTEFLNQNLEIALRAYVGPSRDNWSKYLDSLVLSYNTTPHSNTGFSPIFFLAINQPLVLVGETGRRSELVINDKAKNFTDDFKAYCSRAKKALLAQVYQQHAYNNG